jgi:signal transduction histidine kinase/ActR/RegA family two-component response regulator
MRPALDALPGTATMVLAPHGRDAAVILKILASAGIKAQAQANADSLGIAIRDGKASAAIIAQEALASDDLHTLAVAVAGQPNWSDFPFILLTTRGGLSRPDVRYLELLGNVTLIERPSHPVTLVSAVKSALRSRSRQLEAAAHTHHREIAEAESLDLARTLEQKVSERTQELSSANNRLINEIAERRRTEARLLQAQKMEAIGQLTAGIAHDFNNLLTGVLGNMELLSRRLEDEKHLRLIRTAMQAAERGSKLTGQLLAFSRLQRLTPKPTQINDLITRMSDLLASSMGGLVKVETSLHPKLWPALVDQTQLELVILNLAINARDAMPTGGRLTIETRNRLGAPDFSEFPEDLEPGDYVLVQVSDDGVGMSPDLVARAFEPFFTTKAAGRGTGLGLSQAYGFARQSGGSIRLTSEVGEGTTVTLYLPRCQVEAVESKETTEQPREFRGNVLVVDDDDEVRRVLADMLEELGFTVKAAESGQQALNALTTGRQFDLVLTDVVMPTMNGVELAAAVRERWPSLPVIFASGYADLGSFGEKLKDQDVIRKPYRLEDLARRIDRVLMRAAAGNNAIQLQKN